MSKQCGRHVLLLLSPSAKEQQQLINAWRPKEEERSALLQQSLKSLHCLVGSSDVESENGNLKEQQQKQQCKWSLKMARAEMVLVVVVCCYPRISSSTVVVFVFSDGKGERENECVSVCVCVILCRFRRSCCWRNQQQDQADRQLATVLSKGTVLFNLPTYMTGGQ